jgi:hypothetical protein
MRILAAAVVALGAILTSALPAVAQVLPTPACAAVPNTKALGLAGTNESFAPSPVPSVGTDFDDIAGQTIIGYHEQSVVAFDYVVDVSGSPTVPTATKADVSLTLGWGNDTDFDLYVYDATGNLVGSSVNFNPQAGAGEVVTLSLVAHCTRLHVEVVNYLGDPTSQLTLAGRLSKLK